MRGMLHCAETCTAPTIHCSWRVRKKTLFLKQISRLAFHIHGQHFASWLQWVHNAIAEINTHSSLMVNFVKAEIVHKSWHLDHAVFTVAHRYTISVCWNHSTKIISLGNWLCLRWIGIMCKHCKGGRDSEDIAKILAILPLCIFSADFNHF